MAPKANKLLHDAIVGGKGEQKGARKCYSAVPYDLVIPPTTVDSEGPDTKEKKKEKEGTKKEKTDEKKDKKVKKDKKEKKDKKDKKDKKEKKRKATVLSYNDVPIALIRKCSVEGEYECAEGERSHSPLLRMTMPCNRAVARSWPNLDFLGSHAGNPS